MNKEELWSKGYSYGGGLYIHLHQKDIGAMLTHKPTSVNSLVNTFKNQKNNARKAVQTQYKELFLANVAPKDYTTLEDLFKDNGDIQKIDAVLKQYFQENLKSDKVKQIIENQKRIQWGSDSTDLKEALNKTSQVWQGFDTLLSNIASSVKILNNTDGKAIAAIIRQAQKKKTIGEVGEFLEKALNQVSIDNSTIPGENLQNAVATLKEISGKLAIGDKRGRAKKTEDKKEPLTIEFLKSSIDRNFFSTVLGESIGRDIPMLAEEQATVYIQDVVNNIKSTGKTTVELLKTSAHGTYAGQPAIGEKRQGKADIKFNNVTLSLDKILDGKQGLGEVHLNIGLSNKAYKTLSLGQNKSLTNKSLVTGGSMKINDIFSILTSYERIKYLGYNVLAWTSGSAPNDLKDDAPDITPALLSLQDALFTRATLYLFGARGKEDFANFMFINGQLISMLDIVNRVVKQNNIATTSTMNNGKKQGVIFSIPGRYKWWSGLNNDTIYNHATRVQTLNDAINNSRIEGHINPFAFK